MTPVFPQRFLPLFVAALLWGSHLPAEAGDASAPRATPAMTEALSTPEKPAIASPAATQIRVKVEPIQEATVVPEPEKAAETADKKADEKTGAPVGDKPKVKAAENVAGKAAPAAKSRLSTSDYLAQKEVRDFLKKLSADKKIPLAWLESEVAVARYSPLTEKYTTPKPKADVKVTPDKNFRLYKRNLVNEERIERGVAFLAENAKAFADAEARTGVSRYAIAAIIGVETIYGKNMGRFRVLDALMTLSFDYPRRAKYYRGELAAFLDFCWQQQVKPVSVKGSFAGAMGLGQFMPSSMEAYGRDGDGDGLIDTVNVPADGIMSVANFLKVHGWVPGLAPLYTAKASDAIFRATGSGGIKAHTTLAALQKAGVKGLDAHALAADEPLLLVDLPMTEPVTHKKRTEWYVGTRNFAAILRYNRSYFYAAAVSMLADAIREREASLAAQTKNSKAPG